jgi:hypothetical protein
LHIFPGRVVIKSHCPNYLQKMFTMGNIHLRLNIVFLQGLQFPTTLSIKSPASMWQRPWIRTLNYFSFRHTDESLIRRPRHLIRKNPIVRGQRSVNLEVSSHSVFFSLSARQTNSLHKWSAAAPRTAQHRAQREESFSTNKGEEGERASELAHGARPSGAFNRQQAHTGAEQEQQAQPKAPGRRAPAYMNALCMCRPLLITYHSNASNRSRLTSTLPFDSVYIWRATFLLSNSAEHC